jgi:hypothetical protein
VSSQDLTPLPLGSQEVEEELRSLLGGYDRANLQVEQFEPHVTAAVGRARALDAYLAERWPRRPGTRVYRVIERIWELGSRDRP